MIDCYRVTVCNNLTIFRRAVRFTGCRFVVDTLVGRKQGSYHVVTFVGGGRGVQVGARSAPACSPPPFTCYIFNNSVGLVHIGWCS
jgi:hypothetical protein